MKNIFSPHVREVHILEKRSLRLRVTGIGQAIDALSFISASLKIMGPMNPEASIKLGEEGCGGIELVEISYIPKEKAHHKNVYIVNLTPKLRSATTLIFNEDDVGEVDKRLKQLIRRFEQESKHPPKKDGNIAKLIGEPMEGRDGRYHPSEAYLRQREMASGEKKETE